MSEVSNSYTVKNGNNVFNYQSEEEYKKDLSDGTLDGKIGSEAIQGATKTAWDGVSTNFNQSYDIELTANEISVLSSLESNKNKLNILEGEYTAQESQLISFQRKKENLQSEIEKIESKNSDEQKTIEEKQAEAQKTQEKIAKERIELKQEQQEEFYKAMMKAEKEYDPEKHGLDKNAYIAKQTSSILNKSLEVSSELVDKLSTLEGEIKSSQEQIKSNNTTIGAKGQLKNEFGSMAESKKAQMANTQAQINIVQADIQAGEAVQAKIDDTLNPKKSDEQ